VEITISEVELSRENGIRKIVFKKLVEPKIIVIKKLSTKEFIENYGRKSVIYKEALVKAAIKGNGFYRVIETTLTESKYYDRSKTVVRKAIKLSREVIDKLDQEYEVMEIIQDLKEDKRMETFLTKEKLTSP